MTAPAKALAVHLLTASGAVLAMLALLAAADHKWGVMFVWLVAALIVDGVDGPLARHYDVKKNWPGYDGELLDLIIDYLTYVFIPAFALFRSGLLTGWTGWTAALLIAFSSAIYFADKRMKTADKSFSGFPACWNMVVLVLFAVQPGSGIVLAIVTAFAVMMFMPLRFIHPVRTKRWRWISLPVIFAWTAFAWLAVRSNFEAPDWVQAGLIATSLYLAFAGMVQQFVAPKTA